MTYVVITVHKLKFLLYILVLIPLKAARIPDIYPDEETGNQINDSKFIPKVMLVSGDYLTCSETASFILEYEVWHVDPQDRHAYVQMSLSERDSKGNLYNRQILISEGNLPSSELQLSRLKSGKYVIDLELARKRSDPIGKEIIAVGQALLEVTVGDAFNASRSLTSDYCQHEAVENFVKALEGVHDHVELPSALHLERILEGKKVHHNSFA